MISCHITYEINPFKIKEFEEYARMWIPLIKKFGGIYHGYFLPHEGKSDQAFAVFSFDSLAAYEDYRIKSLKDEACRQAIRFAIENKIVLKHERQFMRPVLDE